MPTNSICFSLLATNESQSTMPVKPKGTDAAGESAAKKPQSPGDQRTSELVLENFLVQGIIT
jgi:hypothetical protein